MLRRSPVRPSKVLIVPDGSSTRNSPVRSSTWKVLVPFSLSRVTRSTAPPHGSSMRTFPSSVLTNARPVV